MKRRSGFSRTLKRSTRRTQRKRVKKRRKTRKKLKSYRRSGRIQQNYMKGDSKRKRSMAFRLRRTDRKQKGGALIDASDAENVTQLGEMGLKFEISKPVGFGGQAEVYKVKVVDAGFFLAKVAEDESALEHAPVELRNNDLLAVKVFLEKYSESVKQEIKMLKKVVGCENIIRYIDAITLSGKNCIITKLVDGRQLLYYVDDHADYWYMDNEELYSRMNAETNLKHGGVEASVAPCNERDWIFLQILRGVACIHGKGVVHCDLSLDNIMIAENEREKKITIIDFGFSTEEGTPITLAKGTRQYRDPYVRSGMGRQWSYTCDMYCCGVILYIMFCNNRFPFGSSGLGGNYKTRASGDKLELPRLGTEKESDQFPFTPKRWELINRLMNVDPKERGTAKEAIEFFNVTEDKILEKVRQNRHALKYYNKYYPDKMNLELVSTAIKENGLALEHAPPELRQDKEVVLEAVQQNGLALEHASPELRQDKDVVLAAVQQNGLARKYALGDFEKETVLEEVGEDGLALKNYQKFKNDKEVVLAAVQQNGFALEHASPELRKGPEVVLAAVEKNGTALQYADGDLRKVPKVVLAAVEKNGTALQYADGELRKDPKVVLAAVKQNGTALQYADGGLRKDEKFALEAISYDPRPPSVYDQLDQSLMLNQDIILKTMERCPDLLVDRSFNYIDLLKDPDFVLKAVEKNGMVLGKVDTDLRKDPVIVSKAVDQNAKAIRFSRIKSKE